MKKYFIFLSILAISFLAGVHYPVYAAVNENFDSYTNGALNGQGGWSGSINYTIQGSITQGGSAKAVKGSSEGEIDKDFSSPQTDGNQIFYFNASGTNGSDGTEIQDANNWDVIARIVFNGGNIRLGDWNTGTILGTYTVSNWYKVEAQWRISDGYVKARINDGTWSSWQAPVDTGWESATNIGLLFNGTNPTGGVFWDSLSEPSSPPPNFSYSFFSTSNPPPATGSSSDLTAATGNLFTGEWYLIAAIIAIPLAFYVIQRIQWWMPKDKK